MPSFEISKSEVTVAQWDTCVQSGDCDMHGAEYAALRYEHPVLVKGNKALPFLEWVNASLPSLHQWRFAATSRGAVQQIDINAPICDQGDIEYQGEGCYGDGTSPVCSLPLGETVQGVCDMIGNAQEMLLDGYDFPEDFTTDGTPACGDSSCSERLKKGVSGNYQPGQDNPYLDYQEISWFNDYLGLRLIRPPQTWRSEE